MTSPGNRPASHLWSTPAWQTPCSPTSGNQRSALFVTLATPSRHAGMMAVEMSICTSTCEGTDPHTHTHLSSVTQRSQNSNWFSTPYRHTEPLSRTVVKINPMIKCTALTFRITGFHLCTHNSCSINLSTTTTIKLRQWAAATLVIVEKYTKWNYVRLGLISFYPRV